MHPKGTFFAFPHPTITWPNYLGQQIETGIYPNKDPEKVCKIFAHSEGGAIFVAQVGEFDTDYVLEVLGVVSLVMPRVP
jgi:hypothetical protein